MNSQKNHAVIVDYGLGNLFSVSQAVRSVGGQCITSDDPGVIRNAAYLILPGVGAFKDGMDNLRQRGLIEPLCEFVHSGRPLLGICLGMQLLMSESEEFGIHRGLDLIAGRVVRFADPPCAGLSYKIPHVGWNGLKLPSSTRRWTGTILEGLSEDPCMYFVHSYFVIPKDPADVLALTDYAGLSYCSVLQKNNVCGCQFHPEKSGKDGLRIFRSFLSRTPSLV